MQQRQPTQAERTDFENRVKSCNEELIPLFEKYGLGLSARPGLTPDGRIGAEPTFTDEKLRKILSDEQQKSANTGLEGSAN